VRPSVPLRRNVCDWWRGDEVSETKPKVHIEVVSEGPH
jgi:hypothetical protein